MVNERGSNRTLKATLEATANEIESGDIILTDISVVVWNSADYYYMGTKSIRVSTDSFPTLDQGNNYWLILSREIAEAINNNLKQQGFISQEAVHQGNLLHNKVCIYRLITE